MIEYSGSMKSKTSITLSEDVLEAVDRSAGDESRSAFIERILREHFRERARAELHARDLERLNREADRLNTEAEEVRVYQGWPDEG